MTAETRKFPDTYSGIDNDKLIDIFAAAPDRLNTVLKDLTIEELVRRPRQDKWSIQEIAIHLGDSEIMASARFRQALAESGAAFSVYDQAKWAEAFSYQKYDSKAFYSALMMFDSLRLNTCKLLRRIDSPDWQKYGLHPEWGTLSVRQLLELYADHGERHFQQILDLRQLLNKPLDFTLLLPERLY